MNTRTFVACATLLSSPAAFSAVMITETFGGSGALVTPGNTGDHTGTVYTVNITDTVGCAEISFDVSVEVGFGPVHFDNRGFGDAAADDSVQPNESVTFSIGPVSASALAGSTLISNSVVVTFDSFDLVHNGGATPAVNWSTDIGTSGSTTTGGGTSGTTVREAGVVGSTSIALDPSANWMWFNNAQFSYAGDVVVEKIPEPSTTLLGLLGGLFLLRRRRV